MNVSESTCGPCIGQGHVPATDSVSLRAFNRNFSGRSGIADDSVYLCSPEVAAVSALAGELVDPRETSYSPPNVGLPADMARPDTDIVGPDPSVEIERGTTIGTVPLREPHPETVSGPVLIAVGDDVTTDHIMPASPRGSGTADRRTPSRSTANGRFRRRSRSPTASGRSSSTAGCSTG